MNTLFADSGAVFSRCGTYRYALTRHVGPGSRAVTFVLLNPSTADATRDDPTIRRCAGFARRWGFGRVVVVNLFAFRATDPAALKRAAEPVGPRNRAWVARAVAGRGPVVCGWGVHGGHRGQDRVVLGWLAALGVEPLALGVTNDGHPRHPLYLPSAAGLIPFAPVRV